MSVCRQRLDSAKITSGAVSRYGSHCVDHTMTGEYVWLQYLKAPRVISKYASQKTPVYVRFTASRLHYGSGCTNGSRIMYCFKAGGSSAACVFRCCVDNWLKRRCWHRQCQCCGSQERLHKVVICPHHLAPTQGNRCIVCCEDQPVGQNYSNKPQEPSAARLRGLQDWDVQDETLVCAFQGKTGTQHSLRVEGVRSSCSADHGTRAMRW